jgi:hypothetical protein
VVIDNILGFLDEEAQVCLVAVKRNGGKGKRRIRRIDQNLETGSVNFHGQAVLTIMDYLGHDHPAVITHPY